MQIYPAIDLRGGHVVRLREGDPTRQTTFSDDPLSTARGWLDAGANWIHVVNLDGAFAAAGAETNSRILTDMAKLGVKVQFGGGLRTLADIEQALQRGASRVVLGTVAVKEPEVVAIAVKQFGADAITVALDARDGLVTTHGWTEKSNITPTELGNKMAEKGVRYALFTDVSRDGNLTGVNLEATIDLGRETGLEVIASGGVTTTDEITELATSGAVHGAVIGMALYEGKLQLSDALKAAEGGIH